MREVEKIIQYAPMNMREMLRSVAHYNSAYSPDAGHLLRAILFAIVVVDRRFFVDVENEEEPYDDNALPIGKCQTISQPSTVARMLLLAELKEGDDVLEVGAGSGWNATLISFLTYPGCVLSVDRIAALVEKAGGNLAKLRNYLKQKRPQNIERVSKVNFLAENVFSNGKIWKRKYNKIIITAGLTDKSAENKVRKLAKILLKQNGLLICPYVSGPLIIYKKRGNKLEKKETREQYVFVPLLGGVEE